MARKTTVESEIKRLRSLLNPAIRGKNTNIILETLASGYSSTLINQAEFIHDQMYIITATDRYLEQRLSDYGLSKPENVGLDDEIFRQVGISVINTKQIRDLLHEILAIMFGDEATKAFAVSTEFQPFSLEDGDDLQVKFDGQAPVTIVLSADSFTNINTASAQEVADAITKELRKQGNSATAVIRDDGTNVYVALMSGTDGPSSTVSVVGGKAQNILKFPKSRNTTQNASTQWTIVQENGFLKFTWSGGSDPSVGKIAVGDYANIYGASFSDPNKGAFEITEVLGGAVNNAYFKVSNPNGVDEIVVQGTDDAILFFYPEKFNLAKKTRYAAVFQSEKNLLQIFLPATTKVVRRERAGAAYLNDNYISGTPDTLGPYIYDPSQPFAITDVGTTSTGSITPLTDRVIEVADSSSFPDESGLLILGYGTSHQEGPIPYIARPSNNTLLISPAYTVQKNHPAGTDIALVNNGPVVISQDGSDYPFYITDVVSGRIYAQELIEIVKASGINVVYTILYPNDIGLGKYGTENSDKVIVWGE
jgi:hypothetical protein